MKEKSTPIDAKRLAANIQVELDAFPTRMFISVNRQVLHEIKAALEASSHTVNSKESSE